MKFVEMRPQDVSAVLPLYIEHYNGYEGSGWTEETASRRIRQVLTMADAYSLMLEGDDGRALGFAMGYFKQYDDLFAYTLEEIVIAHGEQRKGYGSALMRELEARVREKGAGGIELIAVEDDAHERFYGNLGFGSPRGVIPKCKWYV